MDRLAAVFGRRVRALREGRGWTQEELARATGLGPKHIGVIERGEKTSSFEAVEKIAEAFGVDYYQLFVPHTRRAETVEREITALLGDGRRINPAAIEDFLRTLRSAVKKLDKQGG